MIRLTRLTVTVAIVAAGLAVPLRPGFAQQDAIREAVNGAPPSIPAAPSTPTPPAAIPPRASPPTQARPRPQPQGPVQYKILTASARGTYIQIGRDLGKFVAPAAGIELEALTSAGATENVRRLRTEADVKFAMLQSDVYQAYLDQAAAGNAEARQLIQSLRVVLPLYNEEIYFVVRTDSPIDYVHQIEGQRISPGPLGSGAALTTATLFRRLFGRGIGEDHARYQSNEEGLASLVTDQSVDVVVIVAGQPTKTLSEMRPEARDLIKFLRFDPDHPSSKAALETYLPTRVTAANYPNLLSEDLPSLAVRSLLVTYNYQQPHTIEMLSRFARSLCTNFPTLQADGHPKWREVKIEQPSLGRGWRYFPATERILRNCQPVAARPEPVATPARNRLPRCASEEERTLGLCPDTP